MAKDRAGDPQVLACLGRVWLLKGKQDKSPLAMRNSLDYSARALAIAPGQVHFKFNIAFVQIQLAQLMHSLPESQRTLAEVQAASDGLDAAIESFTQIAHSKNPPYPKHDIEQRANMGRNTMRHQLERAVQSQRKYEEQNAAKLQQARETREADLRRRQEERRIADEIAEQQKRKIAEERHKMLQISRELAEQRAEAERRKEEAEYTEDEETGEKVKRKKARKGGKRKKKGEDTDTDGDVADGGRRRRGKSTGDDESLAASVEDGARPVKRRRKLARKGHGGRQDNFKSSEMVVDSDSEGQDGGNSTQINGNDDAEDMDGDANMSEQPLDEKDEEDETITHAKPRKPLSRRIDDDDDDDDNEVDPSVPPATLENGKSETSGSEAETELQPKRNVFADPEDLSMVDANVTAAGDGEAAEY